MTITKAINHLIWRFTDGGIKATPNDLNSLKAIATYLNNKTEDNINENRYFSKITIYTLLREIEYFGDTESAERKINEILEHPLEYWYDRVRLMFILKEFELTKEMFDIKDIPEIWDKNKDENGYFDMTKIREDAATNKELIFKHQKELCKSLDSWDQNEINKKLNFFINELLNQYGNKP